MKIYNRFAVLLKSVYRFFHRSYRLVGFSPPEEPCVYIVHHQNMNGPVHAVGLLPEQARLWVHYAFLKRASCLATSSSSGVSSGFLMSSGLNTFTMSMEGAS